MSAPGDEAQQDEVATATPAEAAILSHAPGTTRERGPKLVVRNLPPKLTKAEFLEVHERWREHIDWMHYEPGELPDEAVKAVVFSVCYLRFTSAEAAAEFSEATDTAAYRDDGGMCRCHVELAPCTRVPSSGKRKADVRENTIEADADFKRYVESFSAPKLAPLSAEQVLAAREKADKERLAAGVIVTPLMAYLQRRMAAKNAKKQKVQEGQAKQREKQAALLRAKQQQLLEKQQASKKAKAGAREAKAGARTATATL